jgi:hypothetical protein
VKKKKEKEREKRERGREFNVCYNIALTGRDR